MKANYGFSKARKNPYARRLKKQITIRLSPEPLDYFKELAREMNIPYQGLINLYLTECARARLRPTFRKSA